MTIVSHFLFLFLPLLLSGSLFCFFPTVYSGEVGI